MMTQKTPMKTPAVLTFMANKQKHKNVLNPGKFSPPAHMNLFTGEKWQFWVTLFHLVDR